MAHQSISLKDTFENDNEAFNPIRPGGGVLRGPDDQIQLCQSETSYSMMLKLCYF